LLIINFDYLLLRNICVCICLLFMVRVYMYEYYYHDMCVHMKVIIVMRMYEYTLRYTIHAHTNGYTLSSGMAHSGFEV
jgi:hypothetical protein